MHITANNNCETTISILIIRCKIVTLMKFLKCLSSKCVLFRILFTLQFGNFMTHQILTYFSLTASVTLNKLKKYNKSMRVHIFLKGRKHL